MKYIELKGGEKAIVDDEDFEWLNKYRWYCQQGYARRNEYVGKINGKYTKKSFAMHRLILNTPPDMLTDHINRNKLDNRKSNLRICTPSENQRNRGIHKRNTSGYIGVSWNKLTKKWSAYIKEGDKRVHLGLFDSAVEAARARDNYVIEHKDYFRPLNFAKLKGGIDELRKV